ncbi:hypothetical protein KSS87_006342 [Heliosperma pusillum]|nr:hypothetical protein KSS87_006342 [Heliosperma pusillum]
MFVNKLVEKATKKTGGYSESLKPEDVNPHVTFHHGIPSAATTLAYDPAQKILALSTRQGQVKLLGKDNTQALLESDDEQPSKFLQFIPNSGVLFNVTFGDRIEVWNIERKILCHVHKSSEEITSFSVLRQFIFVGESTGTVTIWKLDQESFRLEKMKYCIPYSASHGIISKDEVASPVRFILPQPTAESERILLIFADGLMVLWAIQESKAMCTTGGSTTQLLSHETKSVTSTCWVCPFGSKVAVGYNTGDILLYSIFPHSNAGSGSSKSGELCNAQIVPASKLNLGYKLEKIPIASFKWVYSDGKANRLYVISASDSTHMDLVQVILLSEDTENQTIKLGLQLPEPCVNMEIISCPNELSKHKQGFLVLLGKSGRMYAYDDHSIQKYLLHSQKKSSVSAPSEMTIKLPYYSSIVTSAQFLTNHSKIIGSAMEEYKLVAKNLPSLLPSEAKQFIPSHFTGFSKIKNLYITGHSDGAINFWDVSCSLLVPLLSLTQLGEDDSSSTSSGVAVTAVFYCAESRILFSGDKSGMISLINVEGPSVLYHKQIETVLSADITSLQFECFDILGLEKNILVVATRDSSVWTLDADTGNTLSSNAVHPKKPSRALLMKILDTSKGGLAEDTSQKSQLLLLCSEKAAYIYSLPHAVQGEKKVCYKKKFHSSSCYWASLICTSSSLGVMLLFASGKVEIRSLPELSLVKEATLRSLTHTPMQQNYLADYYLCSAPEGEVIMIRSDQEIFIVSMLLHNEPYRHLDPFSQVYAKNMIASEDGSTTPVNQKEKKKGIFGSVFQEITGSKTVHGAGDVSASSEELSTVFSVANFPVLTEDTDKGLEVNDVDLDIDDIDLDDVDGKPKGNNVTALLGKLKQMTTKNEKPSAQEEQPNGKVDSVDQIKRRYGYSSSSDPSRLAKMVQSKLAENVKRLQGIGMKTSEMQEDASSFSAMAKETLRVAEQNSQKEDSPNPIISLRFQDAAAREVIMASDILENNIIPHHDKDYEGIDNPIRAIKDCFLFRVVGPNYNCAMVRIKVDASWRHNLTAAAGWILMMWKGTVVSRGGCQF